MQAIVADTTPLNYLVLIQAADILPNLYRRVLIPPAVKVELAHANTPAIVRAWISQPPPWLDVVSLKLPVDSALAHLDAGEREAISLASELQASLLLMDERDGVTIARHRGLKVVGTLAARPPRQALRTKQVSSCSTYRRRAMRPKLASSPGTYYWPLTESQLRNCRIS
jgi:predicted nucleic acid-binding protein